LADLTISGAVGGAGPALRPNGLIHFFKILQAVDDAGGPLVSQTR